MDQALWALGRGTGVTALVFMTLSIALGIATRSGRPMLSLPRFGVTDVHRSAALLVPDSSPSTFRPCSPTPTPSCG